MKKANENIKESNKIKCPLEGRQTKNTSVRLMVKMKGNLKIQRNYIYIEEYRRRRQKTFKKVEKLEKSTVKVEFSSRKN